MRRAGSITACFCQGWQSAMIFTRRSRAHCSFGDSSRRAAFAFDHGFAVLRARANYSATGAQVAHVSGMKNSPRSFHVTDSFPFSVFVTLSKRATRW